jgi:hypothetical protein
MPRPLLRTIALLLLTAAGAAQVTAPPVILKGAPKTGLVHNMPNGHNSLASLGDGSVVALIYEKPAGDGTPALKLAYSANTGLAWKSFYALPGTGSKTAHDPDSGVMCAGRKCDVVHVAWATSSVSDGGFRSAFYQAFSTATKTWLGKPTLLGAADATKKVDVSPHDITMTPGGTLAIAIGVGAGGGLGMGAWDSGLLVKKKGQAAFAKLAPLRNGGLAWSRDASVIAIDEVVHCSFKNSKGSGGIAYRAFDTAAGKWLQTAQVMVGPNDNGTGTTSGINAGNHSVIAKDTADNVYILYPTGGAGGLSNNHKLRLAYAPKGKGGKNSDWKDLEVLPHTITVGKNPRKVGTSDPVYPKLQGGDTSANWYTLAPGYQGSMVVVYAKPWEDFQNKYVQVWQYGVNVPLPSKELNFWADNEPYMFERLSGMRSTGSVGQGAWTVFGQNTHPPTGITPLAPNGQVRLWALTYQTGRTVSFATGCRGSLKQTPRMSANSEFPILGGKYHVDFDQFPPNALFFLAVGFKCQTIDMTPMGAPGCEINIDFPLIAGLAVNATGSLRLTWSVPNDPKILGAHVMTQSYVLHPTANAAKAITSNALRSIISL